MKSYFIFLLNELKERKARGSLMQLCLHIAHNFITLNEISLKFIFFNGSFFTACFLFMATSHD